MGWGRRNFIQDRAGGAEGGGGGPTRGLTVDLAGASRVPSRFGGSSRRFPRTFRRVRRCGQGQARRGSREEGRPRQLPAEPSDGETTVDASFFF
jgi:hypothetical protein